MSGDELLKAFPSSEALLSAMDAEGTEASERNKTRGRYNKAYSRANESKTLS